MKNSRDRKPRSSLKLGQVWKLGDHRLLVGSSTDADAVSSFLKGVKIDALVTDPPYGVLVAEGKENFSPLKKNKRILNDDITSEPEYVAFTKAWLAPLLPHLARKNSLHVFNSDKMLFALKVAMDELGVKFSQLVIWVKNHAVVGRKDYLPQHELIVFGWFGTHVFRRSKDKSVLFYPKPNKSPLHPTMKPVALIRHLILNATQLGGIVYDPFGGSGTAIVAAEQTKRRCYMVEYDLEYCATIIARWERVSGGSAELL